MSNDLFVKRASVRRFTTDEVPQALIEDLLRAAVEAPSAGNREPWHFYVVRNQAHKRRLSELSYRQEFIASAPVVVVVCAEPERSAQRYAERGKTLYCLQDTAAAIENLLLCATANGLGACWCGAFDEAEVATALELDPSRRPIAIIPIGYPATESKKPSRRPMEEVVTWLD